MEMEKDIKYLRDHLASKKDKTEQEIKAFILYDLYLKHPDKRAINLVPKAQQKIIPESVINSTSEKEYSDIMPKLTAYEKAKEKRFLGNSSVDLIEPTREMLKELIEFIKILIQNVSTSEEKELFNKALNIISKMKD